MSRTPVPPYCESMIELPESLQVIVLAIVQGIAEFLPISSSGHLVALSALFGNQESSLELNVMLHFGTLLSILVFYRRTIFRLLAEDRRVIPLLIAGTIPAGVIGIYVKKNFAHVIENPLLAGFMLIVTAFLLMSLPKISPKEKEDQKKNYTELNLGQAFLIGIMQAIAILPGLSRSGSTIVAGCLVGLKRQAAATFSFLLAIPVIGGAALLEMRDIFERGSSTPAGLLIVGMLISFAVGLVALNLLVRWVESGKLHYFVFWLLPVGFLVIIWQLYELLQKSAENF